MRSALDGTGCAAHRGGRRQHPAAATRCAGRRRSAPGAGDPAIAVTYLVDAGYLQRKLLARMRPHDLRAARNTHLLNARRDTRLVQRFMRHTDPAFPPILSPTSVDKDVNKSQGMPANPRCCLHCCSLPID